MAAPHLDERLAAAAQLVPPGGAVADIGCDHGKLAVWLACTGRYPKVIGADLRPGPLAKASATVRAAHCGDIVELRLGDGLTVLRPGEVQTVIIAGVSAQTTIDMLSAAPWVMDEGAPRLVFIPATKHADLRTWLCEHGFVLRADLPIKAGGRWYAVMAAEYAGDAARHAPSLEECLYGNTPGQPGAEEYAALQRGKLRKLRLGLLETDPLAQQIDAHLADCEKRGLACGLPREQK